MGTIVSYQRYFWKRTGHSVQFAATIPTDERLCQCQEELQERGTLNAVCDESVLVYGVHEMGWTGTA
jgi:hypothetical protein